MALTKQRRPLIYDQKQFQTLTKATTKQKLYLKVQTLPGISN